MEKARIGVIEVSLVVAVLGGTVLGGTILGGAILGGAILNGTILGGAILNGTILNGTWALPASAIVIRGDAEDEASLAKGRPFDAVGRVNPDGCCTLIAPRWVITAAHVARGLSPFSRSVRFGDTEVAVRRVILHPDSRGAGPGQPPRVDLALLELEEPVTGVTPIDLYRAGTELQKECTVVGFGDFGPAGQLRHSDGRRRAAANTVERVEPTRLAITFTAPPGGLELEGVGAPGDSGGPLLIAVDEVPAIAGVSSASMGGRPGEYGVIDLYTRVSAFAQWIDEAMKNSSEEPASAPAVVVIERSGLPKSTQGKCVAAFFEAYNSGDRDALLEVARSYRAKDLQQRRPNETWVETVLERMRKSTGPLRADRFVESEDGKITVLAEGAKSRTGEWHELKFMFQRRAPHGLDGVGLAPAVPPPKDVAPKELTPKKE